MKTSELSASLPAQRAVRTHPWMLFVRNFFKHPKMLGAVMPSSRTLIDKVLSQVDWDQARLIIEYGPGVGSLTTEILRRMRPEAKLLAVEMNGDFVEYLRGAVTDPRLHVIQGSAADTGALLRRMRFEPADCIISGIPFSTMPLALREEILQVTQAALRPEGKFLVYQYSQRIFPSLQKAFGQVQRELLSVKLVPMWLFQCSK